MQASNILFVDDHEEVLDFFVSVFSEDYRVTTSTNGEAALELLGREIVDLVISDVMMPAMDGFELCRRIKTPRD